jgi:hypothetical protein
MISCMPRRETRYDIERALSEPRRQRPGLGKLSVRTRGKRRPGDGSVPALVEPPRGPKPLQGGAAAPLEFD